ncbi:MAG TPA: hypothetical protein VJZ00_02290 [Thermoanaerobaculia bacterium]|nr:hypothetical protein [Thermoanaerobaculia bacterium]
MRPRHPSFLAALACCLLSISTYAERNHPNNIKYNDTGIRNAKGAAGSAAIEARALLNADDTTDVEVTTGAFDASSSPTGTIDKLKLGGVPPTNYNHVEGDTVSAKTSGLLSHDTIAVEAYVKAGYGTEKIDVIETVKKRPDLAVIAVIPPGVAVTGTVGRVRAIITEQNGDTGARANCRLLINGEEVDRAENIWVNAGGRVTCAFAPVLEAQGTADFTVVVDSMNPGDWDDANNTKTEPVRIYDVLDEFYTWSASASETEFDDYTYSKRSWQESTRHNQGTTQSFQFNGVIRAAVDLHSIVASASGQSDGAPLFDGSTSEFTVFNTPVHTTCAVSFSANPEVTACFSPETNSVDVDIHYGTGDAIYRSWGWATRQNPFGPTVPLYTWDDTFEEHSLQSHFGSTVALRFSLADGTHSWTAEPFLASLQQSTSTRNQPYRCRTDFFTGDTICSESRSTSTTKQGSTRGSYQ